MDHCVWSPSTVQILGLVSRFHDAAECQRGSGLSTRSRILICSLSCISQRVGKHCSGLIIHRNPCCEEFGTMQSTWTLTTQSQSRQKRAESVCSDKINVIEFVADVYLSNCQKEDAISWDSIVEIVMVHNFWPDSIAFCWTPSSVMQSL